MAKSANLYVRIEPEIKEQAEKNSIYIGYTGFQRYQYVL